MIVKCLKYFIVICGIVINIWAQDPILNQFKEKYPTIAKNDWCKLKIGLQRDLKRNPTLLIDRDIEKELNLTCADTTLKKLKNYRQKQFKYIYSNTCIIAITSFCIWIIYQVKLLFNFKLTRYLLKYFVYDSILYFLVLTVVSLHFFVKLFRFINRNKKIDLLYKKHFEIYLKKQIIK